MVWRINIICVNSLCILFFNPIFTVLNSLRRERLTPPLGLTLRAIWNYVKLNFFPGEYVNDLGFAFWGCEHYIHCLCLTIHYSCNWFYFWKIIGKQFYCVLFIFQNSKKWHVHYFNLLNLYIKIWILLKMSPFC